MKCNSNAYFNALTQKTNKLKNTPVCGNELNTKLESTQKTGYFTDFYDSQGNINDELFQEWLECSGYNNQYLEFHLIPRSSYFDN